MDRPSQVEPIAAAAREIAPGQPRAHHPRQPRRGVMRLRHLLGIGQLAEVDLGEIFGARGAFHPPFPAGLRRVVG